MKRVLGYRVETNGKQTSKWFKRRDRAWAYYHAIAWHAVTPNLRIIRVVAKGAR